MAKIVPFSKKQRQIMSWWAPKSPVRDSEGIICDGSIRAGKTFPMAISFIEWAFHYFDGEAFAMCGKTVGALGRNVLRWLKPLLAKRGYTVVHRRNSDEGNYLDISKNGKSNRFYIFGGRDESSQDLIQGLTLAGVFFDEVALMPESFVNQAIGRCSVEGAKHWFNCNPGSPSHWFKLEWLDKAEEKGYLHIHFRMEDNPSLSDKVRQGFYNRFVGVFFKRYILGLWVMAEGAIYDMWTDDNEYTVLPFDRDDINHPYDRDIAVDYGTANPMVFLEVLDDGENLYVENEYYYNGRKSQAQKTDSQYADDLDKFSGGPNQVRYIVLDPSAASFRAELRNRGYRVKDADNEVLDGIRLTATLIGRRILKANRRCVNFLREMQSYVWDPKPTDKGNEKPLKKDDHAPDAIRYRVKTLFKPRRLAA